MLVDVELRHLRAFVAVVRRGSFSRAAEDLLITQPALSRTVAQLEKVLGVELVDRSAGQVGPTAAGREFLGHAEQALAALGRGGAAVRAGRTVRLGFSWLLPDPWAQRAMTRFERASGASVQLVRCDDPLRELGGGAVDVAVVRGAPRDAPPGSRAVHLHDEARVAVCARRSALPSSGLDWSEVPSWPLVVNVRSGTTGPWSFPAGRRPERVVETGNFDEWLESVAADRGIGVVPDVARRRTHHPAVRFVPLIGAPPSAVHLVHPGRPNDLVRGFLDAATAVAEP
ncbi:LysR family transcriptional regulator [Saccharopolyspora gregorii]|uniref:LysR family transcriptional regulator n=1 Tax=Saccharopolyspora gregorii TaxID=33914 RepID=UPI0031E52299